MSSFTIDSIVDFKENHITYDGNKYFRRNADKIVLGCHGQKRPGPLSVNYMSVTAKIANRHLENVPIKVSDPIEVDWEEVSSKELNPSGKLKFFGFDTDLASNFNQTLAVQQNLKLMCFWINEGPLKKCLNNDANAVRNAMAAEGKDARIVSSILVAMEIKLAEHFSTNSTTSLTVSDMNGSLGITAGTGRIGSKTIQLVDDATIGYGLSKVKGWKDSKGEIKQLQEDWFSFG